MAEYKSGQALIEVLNAHGVDKIFLNPGGEFVDAQSCVAAARTEGKKAPQLVLCLDEAVAASAAYGNYMITGKPQVVMVHSELGTLQLGANLTNLQWGRVPAVILSAYQEIEVMRTIWNGQPYDQGGIVRNNVKYDRRLEGSDDLHEALTEAFRIACTEPTGPVYLCFPSGYLYQEIEKPEKLPVAAETGVLPAVDMDILEEMADMLLKAKHPLLVSGTAGRYHGNVAALTGLAETLSASVIPGYSWMNFPSNHPLCACIEQIGGSRKQDTGYDEADVIIVIDYDIPYVRSAPAPRADARILQIDVDPLTQGRLLFGRGADLFMKADAREAIPALDNLLKAKITADKKAELEQRFLEIAARNEKARQEWYDTARAQSGEGFISADYLFYCLNQVIDEDSIVVNHTLSHCASATEQIVRTKPGTWFGCPSGGIGWAPGAGLGAASAAPGKTVVAIMSDGGFIWGCPTSVLWTSANYRFPFLSIICNNRGYGAIRIIQPEVLGEQQSSEQFIAEAAVDFQPDYAMISQGAGAFGRTVKKSEDVLPALKEALAAVRDGRPAVLDVYLPRDKR